MHLLKVFFFTFFLAVLQASVLVPIFKCLVFSPHIAVLFLWIYGRSIGDRTLIIFAFFLGLFFDALSNTWGAYIFATVLFTYIYTILKDILIVRKESYEFLFIIPLLLILYKLILFPLVSLKTEVHFSIEKFGISFLLEYLSILYLYRLRNKTYEEA